MFTSPAGRLRDPSNTQADLRDTFARLGYQGITSHTFRRTVGTLMDQAGLSARAAADQLGHAKVSMTQDRYFGRKVRATGAAAVLEALDRAPVRPKVWVRVGVILVALLTSALTWWFAPPTGLEPVTLRLAATTPRVCHSSPLPS